MAIHEWFGRNNLYLFKIEMPGGYNHNKRPNLIILGAFPFWWGLPTNSLLQ
jgi:hypothetical protein